MYLINAHCAFILFKKNFALCGQGVIAPTEVWNTYLFSTVWHPLDFEVLNMYIVCT